MQHAEMEVVVVPWPPVAKALNQATVNVRLGARPGLHGNMRTRLSAGQLPPSEADDARGDDSGSPHTRIAAAFSPAAQALAARAARPAGQSTSSQATQSPPPHSTRERRNSARRCSRESEATTNRGSWEATAATAARVAKSHRDARPHDRGRADAAVATLTVRCGDTYKFSK